MNVGKMAITSRFHWYVILPILLVLTPYMADAAQLDNQDISNKIINVSTENGIIAKGTFFENTAIIEFTNNSMIIKSFTFWLDEGSFKSFKTEIGWSGKKTPDGMIIFTTLNQLGINESVKIGVKTNELNPSINWQASDNNENIIGSGQTSPESEIEDIVQPPIIEPEPTGVFENSTFRIIPEKPKVGSTVRVTGEGFGSSQQFNFYIDTRKLGTFLSDEKGNFITSVKIPDDQKADRVNFRVIDSNGNERVVSLRLGDIDNRVPERDDDKLTVNRLPTILHRGDALDISGTAQPGSAVTISVKDTTNNIINTRTAEVDSSGKWGLTESIIIPLDADFGKYSTEISDGKESLLRTWEVKSEKVIIIESSKTVFQPGEIMKYSGTALPNESIEFVLEDPLGKEVFSKIINTDGAGYVEFEYETYHSSTEGTYTLIITQEGDKEFIFTGLGQLPTIPINLEFDKLNYKSNDTPTISITGNALDMVNLLIIDQADKPKPDISIELGPDGVATYLLDISKYKSGVYTAVISKGSSQSTEIFTVGLKTSIGEITANPTKQDYHPGDSILILGETDPNSLLVITLTDPDGNEISKDTFSDRTGRISEDSFRIPSDAKPGSWLITTKSGSHFDTVKINITNVQEGMIILVEEYKELHGTEPDNLIIIKVIGASPSQKVIINIISNTGDLIQELSIHSTSAGEATTLWETPKNIDPGIYTITAKDAFNNAQTTYQIN